MTVSKEKPLLTIIPPERIPIDKDNMTFLDSNAKIIDSKGGIMDSQEYSIVKLSNYRVSASNF